MAVFHTEDPNQTKITYIIKEDKEKIAENKRREHLKPTKKQRRALTAVYLVPHDQPQCHLAHAIIGCNLMKLVL